MYQKIKQLADEAIALQNKLQMDAALHEISSMCHQADVKTQELIAAQREALAAGGNMSVSYSTDEPIATSAAPAGAEPASFETADAVQVEAVGAGSFGLAHIKMQGCALHPDDTDADLTDDQYARQLAAHERDIAAGGPAKASSDDEEGGAA